MTPRRLIFSTAFLFLCAVGSPPGARGQEGNPPATTATTVQDPDLDKAAVQQRISAVEGDASLDETIKQTVLENLQSALRDLENAEQYQERTAAFRKSIAEDPAAAEAVRAQLAQAPTEPEIRVAEGLSAEEASNERDKEQSSLSAARDELEGQDKALQALRARPDPARAEQEAATADLAETETALEAQPAEGTPALAVETRRIRLNAHRHALSRQLQMLEQELLSLPMQIELATAVRDRTQRQVDEHTARVAALEEVVTRIRSAQADLARQRAEREEEAAADQHPVVRRAAEANTALSALLAQAVSEQQPASEAKERTHDQLTRVQEMHERVETQLERSGLRGVSGTVLRRQRQQLTQLLRDVRESEDRWRGRSTQTDGRQLELYLIRRELADLGTATEAALAEADPPLEGADRDNARTEIEKLLETRRGLVESLDVAYRELLRNLQDLESDQADLQAEVASFSSLLDEWLLWMPSATAPPSQLPGRILQGLEWLVSPTRWQAAGDLLVSSITERWPLVLLAAIALALLVFLRRRARSRLKAISGEIRRVSTDHIGLTWQALGLVVVLAAPLPFLFASLALALQSSDATRAIGVGVLDAAFVGFVIGFLMLVCATRGVGELHFKWRVPAMTALRRHLRWLRWPIILATFLVSATETQPNEDIRNGLGRLAFIIAMLALLVFWQRILRPGGEVMQSVISRRPQGWFARLKWVWYPGALAVVLSLAVLAGLGYYYTALELDVCLFRTIYLILAVALFRAIAIRWLLITQRRMALERFRQQRESRAGEEKVSSEQGEISIPDDFDVDLSAVSEQTRSLIGTTSVIALALGVWAIWLGVLPALGVLDGIRLWTYTATAFDGTPSVEWTSMQDIGLAFLALFLTITATRNIPGLMQVVVLKNLPLEPSIRYAIVSVARYVLTIIGTIVIVQMLGFNWSSLQWLVAALGVGIGFGLQEIIANFVCGLILLFERPVRIGDSVTVGETSGTVSRIRIRATTIIDWDRKEMVIPNKELITGRVLNWTLSNNLNRVVIRVGVAYGTDTERVRRLLEEVASTHPKVLRDPAPLATFEGFGASTLDFILRVFLADYEGRLATVSQLHTAVDEAFKAAGIEIAFPQLDLHVRSAGEKVVIEGPPSAAAPEPRSSPV